MVISDLSLKISYLKYKLCTILMCINATQRLNYLLPWHEQKLYYRICLDIGASPNHAAVIKCFVSWSNSLKIMILFRPSKVRNKNKTIFLLTNFSKSIHAFSVVQLQQIILTWKKQDVCVCVFVYVERLTSLTIEPIWFSFTVNPLTGPWQVNNYFGT